ncbi:hypothetical protein MBLNU457_6698t1 [Dothideomycetes sp. NU457]
MDPTQSTTVPVIKRSSQACDACKLRKVKCNGQARCQQCSHLDLKCVYSAPRQRRKPSKRGEVIERYKTVSNGGVDTTQNAALNQASGNDFFSPQSTQTLPAITSLLSKEPFLEEDSPGSSTSHYAAEFYFGFLQDYEASVYPVNPVITVDEARDAILEMHTSREASAFVHALVAVTINLTHVAPEREAETKAQTLHWVEETIKRQCPLLLHTKVTPRLIMTCQFMHICFMGMSRPDLAFYYLRQSITLIQIMRIDDPETMQSLPLIERARRQRLYWEAFVHERYNSITDCHAPVLQELPIMPENDPSIPHWVMNGFNQIIGLFRLLDKEFIHFWQSSRSGQTDFTSSWIENKQREIDAEPSGDDNQVAGLTQMQQSDLIITKHWLRTLVWQLAISKCMLTSSATKESMSLMYPVRLSSSLRSLVSRMSRHDIEIHGSGIKEKLFEMTDTIANVIITVPAQSLQETAGRVEDFTFLIEFLFSLPRFDPLQKEILQKKLETLQEMFSFSINTPQSSASLPEDLMLGDEYVSRHNPWLGVVKNILEQPR